MIAIEPLGTLDAAVRVPGSKSYTQRAMVIAALAEGVDCVCGIRAKRNDSTIRRLSSKIANGFRNWITREACCTA